ncbi:MAG: diguanylate cyclase domain-containing protein [Oscillospiraceae bacterium]
MEVRSKKFLYKGCWLILAVLGILALKAGFAAETSVERLSPGRVTMLDGQWEMAVQEETGVWEYRYLISEDADDSLWFCMKTYLPEFQLFLDGEKVYSFSNLSSPGERSQHMIKFSQSAHGKILMIQTRSVNGASAKANQIGSSYLGQKSEVLSILLWDNMYALAFLIFSVLLGVIMLLAAFLVRESPTGDIFRSLLNFGIFVLIAGVWVLTDSELMLFVTDKVAVVSLISFVSFMIMPVFLLRFINSILGEKRIFDVLCRLYFVIAALYLVNYQVRVVPGYTLLIPTHLLCICSAIFVIKTGLERLKRSNNKEIRRIMEGFVLLTIFIVVALILFYINPFSHYSYFYCIGFFFFILCLMSAALSRLHGQMEENANTAAYRRLAYMDAMTGLENRAAFMEEQCRENSADGLSLILFDINNLKRTNDLHGHQEGDFLIVAVARCIRDIFGEKGKCYRIGGDEFVVILKDGSASGIDADLQSLRARIARENEKRTIPLEIAAGYAVRQGAETAEQLYKRADASMYEEKQKMKAAEDT